MATHRTSFTPVHYLFLFLLLISGALAHAQMGATSEQCIARYGKPERDAMKESGLLCFRNAGFCAIAHFDQGHCDVLSIFSPNEMMGLPEELSEEPLTSLLQSEGGGAGWKQVGRFSINSVWNSSDNKSFAIYDTMRHKLVIMTRAAYSREKKARMQALAEQKKEPR